MFCFLLFLLWVNGTFIHASLVINKKTGFPWHEKELSKKVLKM